MKKLVLVSLLGCVLSANVFANCAAIARSSTDIVKTGLFIYPGHFEVSINNTTGTINQYEICTELHSQFKDHTFHAQAHNCYTVTINPGHGYQKITDDFKLTTAYHPSQAGNDIFLDAILTVKGECTTVAHENKKVNLIKG